MTTITDRQIPHGRAISALSLAVWKAKLEKNYNVRHNMTQIASLLVTIFTWLMVYNVCILQSERGVAYTRDKTTYAGTWAKNEGGGVGVFAGFYGTLVSQL